MLSLQILGGLIHRNRFLKPSRIQTHSFLLHLQAVPLRHPLSHHLIPGVPSHFTAGSNPSDLHSGSRVVLKPTVIPNALIEVSPNTLLLLYVHGFRTITYPLDPVPAGAPPQVTELHSPPGVVPEPIDCSPPLAKVTSDPSASNSTAVLPVITVQPDSGSQKEKSDSAVQPQPGCLQPPRTTYELVDPLTLTRSPSGCPTPELDSLTATPLPPHSPSWFSRNVQTYQYHPSVEPPSPSPLIVPPPVPVGFISPPPNSALFSEEEFQSTRILHTPSRPSTPSRLSSSHTPRYCSDRGSSLWKSRSPTVVGQSSPSFLRRSNSFTPENSPAPRQGLLFLDTLPRVSANPSRF